MSTASLVSLFGKKLAGTFARADRYTTIAAGVAGRKGANKQLQEQTCHAVIRSVAEMFIGFVITAVEEEVLKLPKKSAFTRVVMKARGKVMRERGELLLELKLKLNRLLRLKDIGHRGVVVYFSNEKISNDGKLSARQLVEFHSADRFIPFTPKSRAWFFAKIREAAGIRPGTSGQKKKRNDLYTKLGWDRGHKSSGGKFYPKRDFFDRAILRFRAKFDGKQLGKCVVNIKQIDKTSVLFYYG